MENMKLDASDVNAISPVPEDAPAYPYGLRIELSDESMKKLGLESLPTVGTKMELHAIVVVERASQNETKEGKRQDMSLQITDMELGDCEGEENDMPEKKLYNTDGSVKTDVKPTGKTILVEL
jgi:hypothetical protein